MNTKSENKNFPPEAIFLIVLTLIVCFVLSAIIAFYELNYGRNLELYSLIVLPFAVFWSLICVYYLYKKDVIPPNSRLNKKLELIFGKKRI